VGKRISDVVIRQPPPTGPISPSP